MGECDVRRSRSQNDSLDQDPSVGWLIDAAVYLVLTPRSRSFNPLPRPPALLVPLVHPIYVITQRDPSVLHSTHQAPISLTPST